MKRTAAIGGCIALLAPGLALANTGIGLLALSMPTLIVALMPAILVEAPVLARVLRVTFKRGLALSAAANIFSTIVGAVIAFLSSFLVPFAEDMYREAVLISLVPMFFVTWWLETLWVRRTVAPEIKPLGRRAAGIANAITYAGMAIAVAIFMPPRSETFSRYRLGTPFAVFNMARNEVAEHYKLHKAWPRPHPFEVAAGGGIRTITLLPAGKLVMVLSYPRSTVADGKHIVYEPRVVNDEIVEWRCYSPDMDAKHLPASCR